VEKILVQQNGSAPHAGPVAFMACVARIVSRANV